MSELNSLEKDTDYSDYIVYADETGDHSLNRVYQEHPIFALSFTIFNKCTYNQEIIPNLNRFKFDVWGHDGVILHSHKIRKQREDFAILANKGKMDAFMHKMNAFMMKAPMTIISTVIDKRALKKRYSIPKSPYNLSLLFCVERLSLFLAEKNQKERLTYILVESRGKKEDRDLELEFRKILTNGKNLARLELIFVPKSRNLPGLQIADLIIYPIGRYVICPEKRNRSYEIIERKIHKFPEHFGKGLKIFPKKSEIPLYNTEGSTPTENPQSIFT